MEVSCLHQEIEVEGGYRQFGNCSWISENVALVVVRQDNGDTGRNGIVPGRVRDIYPGLLQGTESDTAKVVGSD